jgi:hypothetical protein
VEIFNKYIKNVSPELILEICPELTYCVARYLDCSADLLEKLSDSTQNDSVIMGIIQNKICPTNILEKIEKKYNDDEVVRRYIAYNRNCSTKLLERLSVDMFGAVRHAVIKNPYCPIEVLENLKNDVNPDIRKSAIDIIERRSR